MEFHLLLLGYKPSFVTPAAQAPCAPPGVSTRRGDALGARTETLDYFVQYVYFCKIRSNLWQYYKILKSISNNIDT